jgi:hypothetical protein
MDKVLCIFRDVSSLVRGISEAIKLLLSHFNELTLTLSREPAVVQCVRFPDWDQPVAHGTNSLHLAVRVRVNDLVRRSKLTNAARSETWWRLSNDLSVPVRFISSTHQR